MIAITFVQVTLCVLLMISPGSPINISTLITGILYMIATAAQATTFGANTELHLTSGYIKEINSLIIKREYRKSFYISQIALFVVVYSIFSLLILPLLAITLTFDIIIGRFMDTSFSSIVNLVIRMTVFTTAISIGLRSGNAINAIQTFTGFDLIDAMDKLFIDNFYLSIQSLVENFIEYHGRPKNIFFKLLLRAFISYHGISYYQLFSGRTYTQHMPTLVMVSAIQMMKSSRVILAMMMLSCMNR